MKNNLNLLFILSMFSLFLSCRTAPENESLSVENISSVSPISVKINFLGAKFENNNNEKKQGGGGVIL